MVRTAKSAPYLGNVGYILPADAFFGEQFFISDLIEDFLATSFWYSKTAAEDAVATWNGFDLIIDHSSYKVELIG